jgi:hypothetical protein
MEHMRLEDIPKGEGEIHLFVNITSASTEYSIMSEVYTTIHEAVQEISKRRRMTIPDKYWVRMEKLLKTVKSFRPRDNYSAAAVLKVGKQQQKLRKRSEKTIKQACKAMGVSHINIKFRRYNGVALNLIERMNSEHLTFEKTGPDIDQFI